MVFLSAFSSWFQSQSLLEILGVISGLLCVYLAAKNIIWNWPVAIVSVIIYIFIFWDAKLYADMGLQVYFLIMSIYGWYFWRKKAKSSELISMKSINKKELIIALIAITFFTLILGTFLFKRTDASFPFIDSFCTACSLVAQVFLARKVLENWLIWIFVDLIYIGVYVAKDLQLTAGMYAIYIYIAAMGYIEWRKNMRLKEDIKNQVLPRDG